MLLCPWGVATASDGAKPDRPAKLFTDWEADKKRLDNADCDEIFDILWGWSKKGNLEARFRILLAIGFMEGPYLILPIDRKALEAQGDLDNNTRSELERQKFLMAAYSVGPGFTDEENSWINVVISDEPGFEPSSEFGSCMKKGRSQKCLDIVVKSGKIPSWEEFVAEKDALLRKGKKPTCPQTMTKEEIKKRT